MMRNHEASEAEQVQQNSLWVGIGGYANMIVVADHEQHSMEMNILFFLSRVVIQWYCSSYYPYEQVKLFLVIMVPVVHYHWLLFKYACCCGHSTQKHRSVQLIPVGLAKNYS